MEVYHEPEIVGSETCFLHIQESTVRTTAISLKDFLHKQHYVGGLNALLHRFWAGD